VTQRRCRCQTAASRALYLRETIMLKWALFFFVISIVAGLFGFTGISVATAQIARILFFIFLVVFLVFLVLALMAGRAVT
jgi:uncharacterized membrane protein YtjA (UPF0391 family)